MSQLQLFRDSNFKGGSLTLTESDSDLRRSGMSDKASSCEVTGGAWLLYDDVNFRGDCKLLVEGKYNDFKRYGILNDTVSSVRKIPHAQGPTIMLFEHVGFRGNMVTLTSATNNFKTVGFNDKVSSIIVVSGKWHLFTDAEFNGIISPLTEGYYISPGMFPNDGISSAKPV